MNEHRFTLTIRGALNDDRLDALFAAGCDDATFSTKGDLTFGEFDRDASTVLEAVLSAISAVESVAGAEVLHVDPDELVWASEIAHRLGRSRQSIDMLIKGQRGPGGFPPPASHAARNPLWRWSEVELWFDAYEGRSADAERSVMIGVLNAALQARQGLRSSTQRVPLRRAVRQLLAS
jgi:predicted DNA-binding transcriptional regulator AlpA